MGSVEIEFGSERRSYEVERARPHRSGGLVKLRGVDDADSAGRLVGGVLTIPASRLPALDSGTYYHFQLVGLSVRDESGAALGEIADIVSTGGADLLVVRSGEREHLIPAAGGIVRSVDLAAGVVVVRPPEGLLDL
jgi:16S rRNA processing protein RimM